MAAPNASSQGLIARSWQLLAAALVIECGAIGLFSQQAALAADWMPVLRLIHLAQIVALLYIAAQSFQLLRAAQSDWQWQARWFFIALLFAFAGDVINSGLIDLSGITGRRHLLSIPAFAVMQSIYVWLFWRSATVGAGHETARLKTVKWLSLMIWLPITVMLWRWVFDLPQNPLIERATLFYVGLVVLMGLTSSWLLFAWGRLALWITAGAMLFVLSDALIGLALNQGRIPSGMVSHAVWLSYIGAQCLIAQLALKGHSLSQQ